MNINKTGMGICVATLIVIIGFFLYNQNASAPSTQPPSESLGNNAPVKIPSQTDSFTTNNISSPAPIKEFTVTSQNFSFSPSTLTVNTGDHVKITFKNNGGTHDFLIDEFNIASKRIKGGEEDIVEFIADKTGVFEYYCSVGNHRAMGMKGTLVVQ